MAEEGTNAPQDSSNNTEIISVEELKPGFVLFEELSVVGMKAGQVLSSSDIEKILKKPEIRELRVLKSLKQDYTASKKTKVPTVQELEEADVSDSDRGRAVTDTEANKRLKRLIALKKDFIRGENYEDRIDRYREESLQKYRDVLKEIQANRRGETLKIFDEVAVSRADFDGIKKIEPKSAEGIADKIAHYEAKSAFFLHAALNYRQLYSSFIEEVVVDFINDIGYELARALFAGAASHNEKSDYNSAHAVQVMVVSLVTAIEMSRMIKEKSDKLAGGDLNTFLAISKKFFSLEDLVNLGIAALLHDIEIKNRFPNLTADSKMGYEWETILGVHPSNGFHLCKRIDMDFEIQRAVYQHHERFDGSGYPNGLFPRFFTKYTPILMFAEYYVELTTHNPYVEGWKPPREVLLSLLEHGRQRFDGDVVYAFVRSASLFPVGSWLLLSNGDIGIVMDINRGRMDKPILKMFFNEDGAKISPYVANLAESDVEVVRPVDIYLVKKMAGKKDLRFILEEDEQG